MSERPSTRAHWHMIMLTYAFSKEVEVDELVDAMCYLGYEKDKRARTQDVLHRIFAGPQREFDYSVDNGTQAMDMSQQVTAAHQRSSNSRGRSPFLKVN